MKSHHNMSRGERILRLIVGPVFFVSGFYVLSGLGVLAGIITPMTVIGFVLALIGVVQFTTGLFAYCPMYALMHKNTCEACNLGETHKHRPA